MPMHVSLAHGAAAGGAYMLLLIVLEMNCVNEVKALLSRKGGKRLYALAILANLCNTILIGSLTYYIAGEYVCKGRILTFMEQVQCTCGVLIIEGLLYYYIHKAFHEVPGLYWMHKFHHRFNTVVLPSSASAVSVAEFVIAYMFPILAGGAITRADLASTFTAAVFISIGNLAIHTPFLEEQWPVPTEKTSPFLSWLLLSTSDHLRHHRRGNEHYSAPILHFDRILGNTKVEEAK